MERRGIPEADAVNGQEREIYGRRYNTATIVNQALERAAASELDLVAATESLARMGNRQPAVELVERYARETAILAAIAAITGNPAITRQIGKWNMATAESIHGALNGYLGRRIAGQRSRWSETHNR